jgi:uncharacterized protein YecE (DUF72 family)
MFDFYARYFNTVEINNTFYRLPPPETFTAWRENSPRNFRFAVKANRFITHMKKLKDPAESIERLFLAAEHLEQKLSVVLFQMPPHWQLDIERLAEFLAVLPKEHRHIVEFRDESWLIPDVYALLRKYNVGHCIHDIGGRQWPIEVTANFAYIRFHGPGAAKYRGSYSDGALAQWAERIVDWRTRLKAVYVYFNNDIGGWAIQNALTLKEMVEKR